MKTVSMLKRLRDAVQYAKLETAEFGTICRFQQSSKEDRPVRFNDGRIVNEANVTEFIRERVRIHHDSWIISNLEQVIFELQRQVKHTYEPWGDVQWRSKYCLLCNELENHRSHKK